MIKEKYYYDAEDMIQLDRERDFIPLTFDGMFKGLFKKNVDLLKEFVLSQLNLDIDSDMCSIKFLDLELPKDKNSE